MRRSPMKRGTKPIKRGKALKATKALARHVGLAQVGRQRAAEAEAAGKPVKPALTTRPQPAVPQYVRAALNKRSGGICEYPGCGRPATDPHHRKARKIGGRRGEAKLRMDQLANLIHLCRLDHEHVTRNVAEACDMGLIVPEYDDPADVPVHLRYGLVWLVNTGEYHTIEFRQSLPKAIYELYQPKFSESRSGQRRRWASAAARFWAAVDVKADPQACWGWLGAKSPKGYGHFGGSLTTQAHRMAYILHAGVLVPGGLVVMHSCDNPPCCNPNHLSVGTYADNSADMVDKGRSPYSPNERSGKARLTNQQVAEIRTRWAAGESMSALGREYGIHSAHVSRIVHGKRRPLEVDDEVGEGGVPTIAEERIQRDRDAVAALWEEAARLYRAGLTTGEIAARIGQHPSNVSRRLRRIGVQMRKGARFQRRPNPNSEEVGP